MDWYFISMIEVQCESFLPADFRSLVVTLSYIWKAGIVTGFWRTNLNLFSARIVVLDWNMDSLKDLTFYTLDLGFWKCSDFMKCGHFLFLFSYSYLNCMALNTLISMERPYIVIFKWRSDPLTDLIWVTLFLCCCYREASCCIILKHCDLIRLTESSSFN